jgi:N-acyl homoserine lactone hydrolase
VVEYAQVPNYATSGLIYGRHNEGHRVLPYCYVVIKGHGHVAMVDVGYNHKAYGKVLAERYGAQDWHSPAVALAQCGLTPADVDTVFISHAHFDHMGNVEDFPNARIYIQERELSKWVWALSLPRRFRWLMGGIDPYNIVQMVDFARQGKLVCVDGDMEDVLPGIDIHPAHDSHTWGSMYVTLRNDLARNSQDSWVFAGDLVYTQENLRGDDAADPEYVPVGLATGSQFNLIVTADDMVAQAGGDTRRVIAVHEARLKEMFPSRVAGPGLSITELALADGETSKVA